MNQSIPSIPPFELISNYLLSESSPASSKPALNPLSLYLKAYRFAVDLPGFEKNEIHVDVKDGYLTVSAEKALDKDEEDKKERVLRQERYAGACSRSFYVGDVKPEDVKAKYEHGVLTLLVPKHDPKKLTSSSRITIE